MFLHNRQEGRSTTCTVFTMPKTHSYTTTVTWTGNLGEGTASYRTYSRNHEIQNGIKPAIPGSSDPSFRGDPNRYNPEELLVASLSACHMLWVLHLCAEAGIVVSSYEDAAEGIMDEEPDGSGAFRLVTLRPTMAITDHGRCSDALRLHERAHSLCFIARSVNFPVEVKVTIVETE